MAWKKRDATDDPGDEEDLYGSDDPEDEDYEPEDEDGADSDEDGSGEDDDEDNEEPRRRKKDRKRCKNRARKNRGMMIAVAISMLCYTKTNRSNRLQGIMPPAML